MAYTILQLQHFSAVARYGSFSAAARSSGLAQPAISQSIAALEEDLGVRLFDRNSRKCSLTAAGLAFSHEATQILASISESREKMRKFQTGRSGRIILGLTPGISNLIGEYLLRHMHRTAPELDVIIVEAFMTRLHELLREESIDCAVTYSLRTDADTTRAWTLAYEPFCLVGAPKLLASLGHTDIIKLKDLTAVPLFLPTLSHEEGVGQLVLKLAHEHGIKLNVRHQVQSLSLIRRLLLKEDLATITPIGAIIDELHEGRLRALPMVDTKFMYPVQFAISAHRNLGATEKALMSGIQTVAKSLLFSSKIWTDSPHTVLQPDPHRYFECVIAPPLPSHQ